MLNNATSEKPEENPENTRVICASGPGEKAV